MTVGSGADHDVVVVGGGNAGISLAARLLRRGVRDVALVEPRERHHYRPLLSYVGAGLAPMSSVERPTRSLVPDGCTLVPDRVTAVDPGGHDAPAAVHTAGGRRLRARTLVLCPGLEEDWDATPGLAAAYADGWAASTFVGESATRVWPALRDLETGRLLFSVPPEPAPCAPTALKPLLMACDHWRRRGVLQRLDLTLVLPYDAALGVAGPDRHLEDAFASYGVRVVRGARVERLADRSVTVTSPGGVEVADDLAFAHVVPHYRAPRWITDAGLAGDTAAGLVDVDPGTMRHRHHPAVWALGDVADLGTRPSGGALRPTGRGTGRPADRGSCRGRRSALRRVHGHAHHARPSPPHARRDRPRRPAGPHGALPGPGATAAVDVAGGPVRPSAGLLPTHPARPGLRLTPA
ncbi:FAD/NAD(P)-binding oxidoreductase [Nocardioides zeae]|uniref:NAD(P)/FAD-dependent oxidoreductase n=1 Tax=Nocardioides zeae TaxID=1457234 RepID=UPI0028679B7F|nr:FAD/NAD(P)-binding oxidoreductase [Nocardioides zeae]MDR6174899.1 sulfide:quinone oxidoreductase [Nocardioides zeae]